MRHYKPCLRYSIGWIGTQLNLMPIFNLKVCFRRGKQIYNLEVKGIDTQAIYKLQACIYMNYMLCTSVNDGSIVLIRFLAHSMLWGTPINTCILLRLGSSRRVLFCKRIKLMQITGILPGHHWFRPHLIILWRYKQQKVFINVWLQGLYFSMLSISV